MSKDPHQSQPFNIDEFRVKPGHPVDLSTIDPQETRQWAKKKAGVARAAVLNAELEELQEVLWAEHKRRVLVVLQATDSGGKDGTIRHVFEGVNPQGVKVASFKKPNDTELSHDYLWRVHRRTPANGEIMIFNRSHYEDVLVVRVHNIVPQDRWEKRYHHIREFERMLTDEGTIVLKFFLNISKDEQKERLQDRLDNPDKHWKFNTADLKERARWDDYQEAFAAMLNRTSTDYAPWYVIPSNKKWYRTLAITTVLVNTLNGLEMTYPAAEEGLDKIVID